MKKHLPVILTTVLAVIIAMVYSKIAKPIFQVESSAVILRTRIENPEFVAPDNRNRWVWVKDGLALNAQLITDDFLNEFKTQNSTLKIEIDQLRSSIDVNYTGGDEGKFDIKVKGSDQNLNFELNKSVLKRLQKLVVEAEKQTFDDILARLNERLTLLRKDNKKNKNQSNIDHYERIINKMQISAEISQVQSEKNFVIIKNPELKSSMMIWPKKNLLLAAAMLLGVVAGLFIEYLIFLGRKNDEVLG